MKSRLYLFLLCLLYVFGIACKKDKVEQSVSVISDVASQKDLLHSYGLVYDMKLPDFYCTSFINKVDHEANGYEFKLGAPYTYSKNFEIKLGEFRLRPSGDRLSLIIDGFPNDGSQQDYDLKKNTFINAVYGNNLQLELSIENNKVISELLHFNDKIFIQPLPKSDNPKFFDKSIINRRNFKVLYNQDAENKDGLLVLITWTGNSIFDTFDNKKYYIDQPVYKHVYFSQDMGELNFPKSAFDDIPNGAIVYVEFQRSTIRKYNHNNLTHLFKFQSGQQISGIVLDE